MKLVTSLAICLLGAGSLFATSLIEKSVSNGLKAIPADKAELMKLIDDKTYNQKFVLISENKTYKDVLNLVAQKRNYSVKSISNSTLLLSALGLIHLNKALVLT